MIIKKFELEGELFGILWLDICCCTSSKVANEQYIQKHVFSRYFTPGNFGGVMQEQEAFFI